MYRICLSFITILIFTNQVLATNDKNPRIKYNFNYEWKLFVGDLSGADNPEFDDSKWKSISLPHAWNEDDAFKVSIDKLSTGIVWYRKHFKVPQKHKGQKLFLEFEGIHQAGDFYLNGKHIGHHENGVMAFGFDITDLLKFDNQENVIAIRIDNSWDYKEKATGTAFQWNNNNFNANYGGIPKNVYLHVTNKLYQTLPLFSTLETIGSYVYATNIDISNKTSTITAESEIKNETGVSQTFEYIVSVYDLDEKLIKTFNGPSSAMLPGETKIIKASEKLSDLNFWSWGYGYLYNIVISLKSKGKVIDEIKIRTGFRKTEFSNGLVKLNDRIIQLKGYAQRTSNEWPAIGMSVPAWLSDFSNKLMVESNANLVRWMHVTPWKQDVESCDRVGLIQAMPAGDAEKDISGVQWEQRTKLMREAIIYNRNNPSILFYECGNESISEEHMQDMKNIRDKYDPYGGRAIGSREMLDSKVAEYGGEMLYINKSAHIPMWAMEYSRDEGLRKYWDDYTAPFHKDGDGPLYRNAPAPDYNHNQDSHAIENIIRWFDYWQCRPGTGKRVSSGGANIIFSDSNTHFRGAENYRRSGEVDAMRIPKDGFYAHQVMWDGWVETEKHRTHIIGHWNYSDTITKNIYVVSSGDKVKLFINGQSKGFGEQSNHFLFTFKNIKWQAGTIKAISYDTLNRVLSLDSIQTAGSPTSIKLSLNTSPNGLQANGTDLALITVEVVDSKGLRCPTSNQMINFAIDGAAEWRGGIAQGPDNFILSKNIPVECGINRVFIRSTYKSGKIKIKAEANGLKPAEIQINSKPFKVTDGLSQMFPDKGLVSNLERGPTPNTPSIGKPTRIPVEIANATAGANDSLVNFSFDDNELTEWGNDGKISTGWIKYNLEHEAVISEICIKFTGWRMREYPIRVLAGDEEVFNGKTARSLGYVTISLKKVRSKTITVQLIGNNTENDAYRQIKELAEKKELDLYKDPKASDVNGELRIVEIEFYENN
jgi:hypothetical protein